MGKMVRNLDDLAAIITAFQSQGKSVVYASGIFDIVHPTHVRRLRNAKSRGDFLVIGVLEDGPASDRLGAGLPFFGARDRMAVVEALEAVDYVIPVGGSDSAGVLERLRPNVLATSVEDETNPPRDRKAQEAIGGKVVSVADAKKESAVDRVLRSLRASAGRGSTPSGAKGAKGAKGRTARTTGKKAAAKRPARGRAAAGKGGRRPTRGAKGASSKARKKASASTGKRAKSRRLAMAGAP